WRRLGGRPGRCALVVPSAKRFAGPTGLEEYVGYGVGMTLTVEAREGALIFRSKDYFVELFGSRWRLPPWLAPGNTVVTHAELPGGRFSFTAPPLHPPVGRMVLQVGMFREVVP